MDVNEELHFLSGPEGDGGVDFRGNGFQSHTTIP